MYCKSVAYAFGSKKLDQEVFLLSMSQNNVSLYMSPRLMRAYSWRSSRENRVALPYGTPIEIDAMRDNFAKYVDEFLAGFKSCDPIFRLAAHDQSLRHPNHTSQAMDAQNHSFQSAIEERDRKISQKDSEIQELRKLLAARAEKPSVSSASEVLCSDDSPTPHTSTTLSRMHSPPEQKNNSNRRTNPLPFKPEQITPVKQSKSPNIAAMETEPSPKRRRTPTQKGVTLQESSSNRVRTQR